MKEILPAVFHWTAVHPNLGFDVSSYFVADSGTLIDPMLPDDGFDFFHGGHEPQRIVLSNRHHDRQAGAFVKEFRLGPVQVPESGLHEFAQKDLEVAGYAPGEEVAPGIVVHEVGAICPDDMALEVRDAGALVMADGLVRFGDTVRFVTDDLMDDPPATKRGLVVSLERLLELDFDALLFSHGEPITNAGKQALRDFLATRPAG